MSKAFGIIALGGAAAAGAYLWHKRKAQSVATAAPAVHYASATSTQPSGGGVGSNKLPLILGAGAAILGGAGAFGGLGGIFGGAGASNSGGDPVVTYTGANSLQPLLTVIRKHESGNNYDRVWSGIRANDQPPRRLSTMRVEEVLAWQDSIDHKYMSEAAGAYQVMEDTLRPLVGSVVSARDPFSKAVQDKIAVHLLQQKSAWRKYMSGRGNANDAMIAIAQIWASMPVPVSVNGKRPGQSYYAGDGLNKASASISEVRNALPKVGIA